MDVYTHGIGSSCKGDYYRHEVNHLAQCGFTLCGIEIKGLDWWKSSGIYEHNFVIQNIEYSHYNESRICKKCAKKLSAL